MTTIQNHIDFYKIDHRAMKKFERIIMEGILFYETCNYISKLIYNVHQSYFRLIHLNTQKENTMVEGQLIRFIINDILSTGEYTLAGIAYYTDTHEDIIYEIATGSNQNPSLLLSQKLISLHRSIKPDFYKEILQRITNNNQAAA